MPTHRVIVEGRLLDKPLTLRIKADTRAMAANTVIDLLADHLRADLIARKSERSARLRVSIGSHVWIADVRYNYDAPNGIERSVYSEAELSNGLFTPVYRYVDQDVTVKPRRVKVGRQVRPARGKWTA